MISGKSAKLWMNEKVQEIIDKKITQIKIGNRVLDIDLINMTYKEKQNMNKFWMCMVEGSPTSSYRHETKSSAQREAERLAANLGKRVYVLESTDHVEIKTPITWTIIEDVPF